jgi:hypothetical protein
MGENYSYNHNDNLCQTDLQNFDDDKFPNFFQEEENPLFSLNSVNEEKGLNYNDFNLSNTDYQTDQTDKNINNNKLSSKEEFIIDKDEKIELNDSINNKINNLNQIVEEEKDEISENVRDNDKISKQNDIMCDLNIEKNINKLDSINLEEREEREEKEKKEGRVENEEREKKEDKEVTQLNQGIESSIIEQKDNFGRKKKNDTKKGKHNKNSGDNIINKIKGWFFNFIRDFIKKHSNDNKIVLKKLPRNFIADLTKQSNEILWTMKISDILMNQEISTKYSTLDRYENRKIIAKIYSEKEEINVIKILELTFEELFIIFRRKLKDKEDMKKLEEIKDKIEGLDLEEKNNKYLDIEYFIERIKQKDSIFYRSIMDEYIEKIKSLCLGYEEWFKNKNERN